MARALGGSFCEAFLKIWHRADRGSMIDPAPNELFSKAVNSHTTLPTP